MLGDAEKPQYMQSGLRERSWDWGQNGKDLEFNPKDIWMYGQLGEMNFFFLTNIRASLRKREWTLEHPYGSKSSQTNVGL